MINILFNILLWDGIYYAAVYYFPLLFEPQTNYVPKVQLQSVGERYYYYYQLSLFIFTLETLFWSSFITQYIIFVMTFPIIMNVIIKHTVFQQKYNNFCAKWSDKITRWLCSLIAYILNYISTNTYMLNVEYTYSDVIKYVDYLDTTTVYEWFKSLCYGYAYKYIKSQYLVWSTEQTMSNKVDKTHGQIILHLRNKEIQHLLNPNILLYLVSHKTDQSSVFDKAKDVMNFEYFNFMHLWSCLAFIQFYFPTHYYTITVTIYIVLSLLGYYQKPLLWYFFKVFLISYFVSNVLVSILLIRFFPWKLMDIRNKKKLKHLGISLLCNLGMYYILPLLTPIKLIQYELINGIVWAYMVAIPVYMMVFMFIRQYKQKYFIGMCVITVFNINNYNILSGGVETYMMSLGQIFLSHILLFYLYKIKPKKTPLVQLCQINPDYFGQTQQQPLAPNDTDKTPDNNPFNNSKKDN